MNLLLLNWYSEQNEIFANSAETMVSNRTDSINSMISKNLPIEKCSTIHRLFLLVNYFNPQVLYFSFIIQMWICYRKPTRFKNKSQVIQVFVAFLRDWIYSTAICCSCKSFFSCQNSNSALHRSICNESIQSWIERTPIPNSSAVTDK